MRYLLDTNIFLWSLNDDPKLKSTIRKILEDPQNEIYTSVVNGWEISIKHRIGKLPLKTTLAECFKRSDFKILNISLDHILVLDKLPPHHKDPFDRILIAQAKQENLTLITSDEKIFKYKQSLRSKDLKISLIKA